jgi:hypothetical protein
MTGAALRAYRQALGMTAVAFGEAMGYTGVTKTVIVRVYGLEAMRGAIPKADQLRIQAMELELATKIARDRRSA